MDFFSQQEESRRQSHKIIWRFILANILIATVLNFAIQAVYIVGIAGGTSKKQYPVHSTILESTLQQLLDWRPFVIVNIIVFLIIGTAALLKFRSLASSGGAVAQMLGGQKVTHDSPDPLEKRLVNIVDEMSIASGLPVPEVYVLQGQDGINAFASGPTPERSAVAVTRGAIERLSRDELQGVVAHEFSHIIHGDVRLNIRLAAYIYGLLILVGVGNILLELSRGRSYSNSSRKAFMPLLMMGIVIVGIGTLGKVLSVLMSAAISRNREYLADATAVQLTRNAAGLAGALKKIGGYQFGSSIDSRDADGVAHFFLADAKRLSLFDRFASTHPPLMDRIKKLDPTFNGELPDSASIELQTVSSSEGISALQGGSISVNAAHAHSRNSIESPSVLINPTKELISSSWMPPLAVTSRLQKLGHPELMVYAMLMGRDPITKAKQVEIIAESLAGGDLEKEMGSAAALDINQKLSLMLMAIPLIQGSSKDRLSKLQGVVKRLVEADGHTTLFELLSMILIHFSLQGDTVGLSLLGGRSDESIQRYKTPLQVITSIFALCSSEKISEQQAAFEKGKKILSLTFDQLGTQQLGIDRILWSIDQMRNSSPKVRKALMDALFEISHSNEVISPHEQAFLRLSAMLLRMPLPAAIAT
jgi:Zn-dependent protease with chaperone function